MSEMCRKCGGDLTPEGNGFKCTFCGATYASLDELRPKRRKSAPQESQPQAQQSQSQPISQPEQTKTVVVPVIQQKDNGVDVFETNINGVLEITWSDEKSTHSGSGFLISQDGYAVTNTHVVTHDDGQSCQQVNVRLCGENMRADVIKLGDSNHGKGMGVDLALIKLARIPEKAKVVEFENFDNVRIGERVFVIGNSLGYGTCITSGIVSDKLRNVNGKMLLMTDCAINGGNSGGPIFNEMGRVIGAVVSGITAAEGMNFAIPCNVVLDFMKDAKMV